MQQLRRASPFWPPTDLHTVGEQAVKYPGHSFCKVLKIKTSTLNWAPKPLMDQHRWKSSLGSPVLPDEDFFHHGLSFVSILKQAHLPRRFLMHLHLNGFSLPCVHSAAALRLVALFLFLVYSFWLHVSAIVLFCSCPFLRKLHLWLSVSYALPGQLHSVLKLPVCKSFYAMLSATYMMCSC